MRFTASVVAMALLAACGGAVDPGGSGGGGADGGSGGTGGSGGSGGTGGTGGSAGSGGSGGTGDAPGYAHDIQPIFATHCTPCHFVGSGGGGGGGGAPARIIPDRAPPLTYANLVQSAPGCPHGDHYDGCVLDTIEHGIMPLGGGCTGDPALDQGDPACLTATELDKLRRWIDAGGPP